MPVLNHPDGSPVSVSNPLPVSGSFSIASEIEIKNDAGNPVPVSGTVSLDNTTLDALENINITGSVSISNLPVNQTVNGTMEIGATSLAALENITVTVSNLPTTQPVSGTVSVGNFPTTQPVSGTVSVGNFPTTQPVSGTVSVSNLPTTQAVSGNVNISNTPTVSVSNLPTTQAVSGNVSITGNVDTTITGAGTSTSNTLFQSQVLNGAVVSLANPLPIMPVGSSQTVAGTTTAAAGATITLPAGAAGTSHYIDSIELVLFTSTARTGTATPVTVSSTNMGGWGTIFSSAGTLGSTASYQLRTTRPLKSTATATNTTIILPAVTGGIWRYNVMYSTAV